jgi:hypothetical protein
MEYCSFMTMAAKSFTRIPCCSPLPMAKPFPDHWRKPVLHVAVLFAALCLYARLVEVFGGFSTKLLYLQWPEIACVLYLYGLLYAVLKPSGWRPVLAALPIFLVYVVHDVFYLVYGKVFRLINLAELPEFFQILPLPYALLLAALFVVLCASIIAGINYGKPLRIALGLLPMALIAAGIKAAPDAVATGFQAFAHEIIIYSDGKSVERNGRLAMLLYREAQRAGTLEKIEPYRDRATYDTQLEREASGIRPHLQPRNVHLIVLESFLDPRLFADARFSRSPAHPDFERLFGDTLGLSISPVFGGATAQAEFEVLCGLPAFEKISSIEFNVFTGAPAHCLPGLLSELGYRSVASNAYKPNFFNAQPAYMGMGFAEQQFPAEFYSAGPTYLHAGDPGNEDYLFDDDLFAQNLAFVQDHQRRNADQPLFNYVLTIYGHTPHNLDPDKRPQVIQIQADFQDEHLLRAVNQFYYRTQAIARYVGDLTASDPDSLIVLISDHVPPLQFGPNTYNALRYLDNREGSYYYNRVAVIDRGRPVRFDPLRHYDLPELIVDRLTDGRFCAGRDCAYRSSARPPREAYLERYLALMAHASE